MLLRDGMTARLRLSQPSDASLMQQFVENLSPESRRGRFFSESMPSPVLVSALCDSSCPQSQLTVLIMRAQKGSLRVMAAGSYWARDAQSAEVAMAVADEFHGKGLGTILLERLAVLAIRHEFTRLWAVTHADNMAMREVFRESRFTAHEAYEGADMEIELSLIPTEMSVARAEQIARNTVLHGIGRASVSDYSMRCNSQADLERPAKESNRKSKETLNVFIQRKSYDLSIFIYRHSLSTRDESSWHHRSSNPILVCRFLLL
ncbi:GNAT family N-acetyltransferase [Nitrospira sp. KM1]|uniref:GNAT family N-acetyltransferase n=1 Tax=Nitrospira sp. KM1 TaxID=1936990 RepID=UPI00156404C7|nr:GNAT family N-acetyltransferase [Nitrospira sp. KM1]